MQMMVRGEMDAMAEQPIIVGQPGQAGRRVLVSDPFCDVDVHTNAEFPRQMGGIAQRFVGAGESGVDADQTLAAFFDESFVFPRTKGAKELPSPI